MMIIFSLLLSAKGIEFFTAFCRGGDGGDVLPVTGRVRVLSYCHVL